MFGPSYNIPDLTPTAMFGWGLVGIIIYIFTAYCLYHIAKKTNTPNEWWAYVPILNIVLILQIARLSLWWLIALLIPYVNLAVMAYVWWKIAEERRRPGWWGLLMLIAPVNLVMIWLLAFREANNQLAPTDTPQA